LSVQNNSLAIHKYICTYCSKEFYEFRSIVIFESKLLWNEPIWKTLRKLEIFQCKVFKTLQLKCAYDFPRISWFWNILWCLQIYQKKPNEIFFTDFCSTLDSGTTVAPPLKNFRTIILVLFCINLGIAVTLDFFFFQNFSKINKRSPTFILESRVVLKGQIVS